MIQIRAIRSKRSYPIMLGANLRKGVFAVRDAKQGSFAMFIVWLKRDYESGQQFELSDVDSVNAEIRFCDRKSVEITRDVLNRILAQWRE